MRAERKGKGSMDSGEGEQASGVPPGRSCRLRTCMRSDLQKQKQQNTNAHTQAHTAAKQWPNLLSINSVCCRAIAVAIASSAMSIFYQSTRVLQASSTAIAPLSLLLLLSNLAISPHSFPYCHLQASAFKPPHQRRLSSSPFSSSMSTQGTSP